MSRAVVRFALNRVAAPRLRFAAFLDLAVELGATAVEIRNDLPGVEIADGTDPAELGRAAAARGVAILSINALQRFDDWNLDREEEAARLAGYALACGAEALVLCPVNAALDRRTEARRSEDLRTSLRALAPILGGHGIAGLVEPLGFKESALRTKTAALEAIDAVGGGAVFRVVHDTFHHFLAGEAAFFPARTGLVHLSGVTDAGLAPEAIRDEHRVLVDPDDRLGSTAQVRALLAGGYAGPFSFEPFAPSVHESQDPAAALRESMSLVAREATAAA